MKKKAETIERRVSWPFKRSVGDPELHRVLFSFLFEVLGFENVFFFSSFVFWRKNQRQQRLVIGASGFFMVCFLSLSLSLAR